MLFATTAHTDRCVVATNGALFVCAADEMSVCSTGGSQRHAAMLRPFARFPAAREHGYAEALNEHADTIQENA